jgi:two-component system cell cycle sensor histidine kinase/response regulator CckA
MDPTHPTDPQHATMPRILIADDECLTRLEVGEMLTALGYEVVGQAESGLEAIDVARELRPDLILMDVVLPGEMNGIAAASKIKAELDIPIIFISGHGDPEYIERAKEIEPFGYVMKPFDEREVRAFVEIGLHKRKIELALKQANAQLALTNSQIRKASREWEDIFQAIGQPTFLLNNDYHILKANRSALGALGRSEKDLVGKRCYEIFHHSHTPPEDCPIEEMKASGKLETAEMEIEALGRTFLISCAPMFDQEGQLEKVIHIATDITDRKQLEMQIRESHKVKAISTLAGGIAHQFNNALTAITWNNNLIEMKYRERDDISHNIAGIDRSVHKMARLTSQLLAYARGGKYAAKELSLSGFVREILPLLARRMNREIQLVAELSPDVFSIRADHNQLQMVVSALVANAHEATNGPGCIRISVQNVELDSRFVQCRSGLEPGPHVCLSVEDDGEGMDEETQKNMFDPFFTTHFLGRGLGMAAVYGIVKNHEGWIDVDSKPGSGTTVRIYLPAASA